MERSSLKWLKIDDWCEDECEAMGWERKDESEKCDLFPPVAVAFYTLDALTVKVVPAVGTLAYSGRP